MRAPRCYYVRIVILTVMQQCPYCKLRRECLMHRRRRCALRISHTAMKGDRVGRCNNWILSYTDRWNNSRTVYGRHTLINLQMLTSRLSCIDNAPFVCTRVIINSRIHKCNNHLRASFIEKKKSVSHWATDSHQMRNNPDIMKCFSRFWKLSPLIEIWKS